MKSDFVSTVSARSCGAPLTSVCGFAETPLRQDVLFGESERSSPFLGYIASESQRLTAIVDALLKSHAWTRATCR